jgi:hypothetical protein
MSGKALAAGVRRPFRATTVREGSRSRVAAKPTSRDREGAMHVPLPDGRGLKPSLDLSLLVAHPHLSFVRTIHGLASVATTCRHCMAEGTRGKRRAFIDAAVFQG